jgi:hypothetical protein
VFGNLHGFRCIGGRLIRDERGRIKIDRGDEVRDQDYLLPHKDAIASLLAGLAANGEGDGQTQAA